MMKPAPVLAVPASLNLLRAPFLGLRAVRLPAAWLFRAAVLLAVATAACEPRPPPPEPVPLEETLRIGAAQAEGPTRFRGASDALRLSTGEIAVLDNASAEVRVFSPEGTFERRFGRRGGGRGQLQPPARMLAGRSSLAVVDRTRRATLFAPDGQVLAVARLDDPDRPALSLLGEGPGGWVARLHLPLCEAEEGLEPGRPCRDYVPVHAMDLEADELGEPILHFLARPVAFTPGGSALPPLFSGGPEIGLDADGNLYLTDAEAYRVAVHGPDGSLLRTVEPPEPGRPVSVRRSHVESYAAHVRAVREHRSPGEDGGAQAPLDAREPMDELERMIEERVASPRADRLPVTGRILVAPDGAFWVERLDRSEDPGWDELRRTHGAPPSPSTPRSVWDRFDSTGEFRGAVAMPRGFEPRQLNDESVWGILVDEYGVEYAVRLEVPGAAG